MRSVVLAALVMASTLGCAAEIRGPVRGTSRGGGGGGGGHWPSSDARRLYNNGLEEIARLDATPGGWNDATCAATVDLFDRAAAELDRRFLEAEYNAGVVFQRCGKVVEARARFEAVLKANEKYHWARVQLARMSLAASNDTEVDRAIAEYDRAIADSNYQNFEALVELARMQMRRDSALADKDGEDDFVRAKKNLQRALAVNDAYMPAYDGLAAYYLRRAQRAAKATTKSTSVKRGAAASNVDAQALELALLVATQGIRKDPRYASLRNTAGLVLVEMGDPTSAVRYFQQARELDPRFFEAHMNFASVNMLFRGFDKAEAAYRVAIELRPNDYDAHLGLALALRAQTDLTADGGAKLAEAEKELARAKEIDATRPEAYFNHAVLVEQYRGRAGGDEGIKALEQAIALYTEFVERARGKAEFADAIEDVTAVPSRHYHNDCLGAAARQKGCMRGRIFDIKDVIAFAKESAAEQRKLEEEAKTRAAIEEANAAPQER